jgi:uncharacterized protein YjbI with pentapeptide repeats
VRNNKSFNWGGILFISVVILPLIMGGLFGFIRIGNLGGTLLGILIGAVAGVFVAIFGIGMGLKEPIDTIGDFLEYGLIFAWIYLVAGFLILGHYILGAAVCVIPAILLLFFSKVSGSVRKKREEPILDAYYKEARSILAYQHAINDHARTRIRLKTLTVLKKLSPLGKREVIRFLQDNNLISTRETPIDLRGADLRQLNIKHPGLRDTCLDGTDLSKASLQSTDMKGASMRDCDLTGATLRYGDLKDADLDSANLSEADLIATDFSTANLANADLRKARLRQSNLREATLTNAKCRGSNLLLADLRNADIRGADFTGAKLDRVKLHGALLNEETILDEKWRMVLDIQSTGKAHRSLRNADLSDTDLRKVNLSSADLRGANLSKADLRGADLRQSDLREAILKEAIVGGAYIYGAQISSEQLSLVSSLYGGAETINRDTPP